MKSWYILKNTLPVYKSVFPFYESQYSSKVDIRVLSIFLITIFAELTHRLSARWAFLNGTISYTQFLHCESSRPWPSTTKNRSEQKEHYWASRCLLLGFCAAFITVLSRFVSVTFHVRGLFRIWKVSLTHVPRPTSRPQKKMQVGRFSLQGQSDFNPLNWMRVYVLYLCTNKHVCMSKPLYYFRFRSRGVVNVD